MDSAVSFSTQRPQVLYSFYSPLGLATLINAAALFIFPDKSLSLAAAFRKLQIEFINLRQGAGILGVFWHLNQ